MTQPKWLDDKQVTGKRQGDAAEIQVRRTFASGAFWHDKGDIELGEYLLDVKSTKKKSFSLTRGDWEKISKEARGKDKVPGLVVYFEDGPSLVVLSLGEFEALTGTFEEDRNDGP